MGGGQLTALKKVSQKILHGGEIETAEKSRKTCEGQAEGGKVKHVGRLKVRVK